MLPRKERLSRQEFNRFFSIGKRTHSPSFQLVSATYPTLHVSVVVSKKIAKSAVSRNKIRRRMYDIVRRLRAERGLAGVFILLAKQDAAKRSYQDLQTEIRNALAT